LQIHPETLNLTPPRYLPFMFQGASLALWYDSQENQFLALCPECKNLVHYRTAGIAYREMVANEWKCCQGCRARRCFEERPELIGPFLDFWRRTGLFPESASWLANIPARGFNLQAR
jgi:hypothetical protein